MLQRSGPIAAGVKDVTENSFDLGYDSLICLLTVLQECPTREIFSDVYCGNLKKIYTRMRDEKAR